MLPGTSAGPRQHQTRSGRARTRSVRDNALRGEVMYRWLYRVVLRRVPAEAAHRAGFWLIRWLGPAAGLLGRWLGPRDPVLRVRALGLEFPGPVGLAAGFDKDA